MSVTSRLKNLFSIETKGALSSPERWLIELLGASASSSAGVVVTPQSAMTCPPVRRAVQLIAESVGQLPVQVFARGADGSKDRAPDHPAYAVLHDAANEWTPASKFREDITRDALLFPMGGFAFINRNGDGKIIELVRLDPESTDIKVEYANREPTYIIDDKEIVRQDILHIPTPSLSGRGLVHDARETIGLTMTMERHAARLFGNGARPSGVVTLPEKTGAEEFRRIKAGWNEAHGGSASGGTAFLPNGTEWLALTLTSVDAQFLELRKHQIEEIARVFGVPPHMLFEMERATRSNSEQMGSEFLQYSLLRWIKAWEGEIKLKLFSADDRKTHYAEFITDDFARADLATRADAMGKQIAARTMCPNEARAMMNLPPYDGGDVFANPNTSTNAQPANEGGAS